MRLPNPDFWMNKKVFVTGACGFKGTWLVHWLNSMGAIVRSNEEYDMTDMDELKVLLEGFQPHIVIHMAAVSTVYEAFANPVEAIKTNAVGTTVLLEILKGMRSVQAILNITTDKVYHVEGIDRGYTEQDALGGLEMYAVSKVCSENISTVYQKTYRLPLATARAGNVLGGGDWKDSRIIPNYIRAYRYKNSLDVNVNAIRPWQYVLDALCGYLILCEQLFENTAYAGAWNFASNEYESRSVQWIVDEMNKHFDPKVGYRLIDDRGYYETKCLKLCSDKAHKVLNWCPQYSMQETIARTAGWYKAFLEGEETPEFLYKTEIDAYMKGACK